jgi:hypothetical protein
MREQEEVTEPQAWNQSDFTDMMEQLNEASAIEDDAERVDALREVSRNCAPLIVNTLFLIATMGDWDCIVMLDDKKRRPGKSTLQCSKGIDRCDAIRILAEWRQMMGPISPLAYTPTAN